MPGAIIFFFVGVALQAEVGVAQIRSGRPPTPPFAGKAPVEKSRVRIPQVPAQNAYEDDEKPSKFFPQPFLPASPSDAGLYRLPLFFGEGEGEVQGEVQVQGQGDVKDPGQGCHRFLSHMLNLISNFTFVLW